MSMAQNLSTRIVVKEYATGSMSTNAKAVSSTDLVATGGQVLRETACSLNLSKDTYVSAEVNTERQIYDFRHGTGRVQGSISGELSPATYWAFIKALCYGEDTSAVTRSEQQFTSVSADNAAGTFTFSSGNPVTEGFKVGMVIRFTNLLETTNNSKNFLILGMSGTSNRVVSVYPSPTTMGSNSTFGVVSVGRRVSVPSSSAVQRKFAVEVYNSDLGVHRLFTECRVGSASINVPASGFATVEFSLFGRDMEMGSGGSSPFFTSPDSATSTGAVTAVGGFVLNSGTVVGVVTGAQINVSLNPSGEAVVGQTFVPDVTLSRVNITGQITAFFENLTLINTFTAESEVNIILYLTNSSSSASDAISIFLPRVKFSGAEVGLSGEQGVPVTIPFQCTKYIGSLAGVDQSTVGFFDTAARRTHSFSIVSASTVAVTLASVDGSDSIVYWGDGSTSTCVSNGSVSHTYASSFTGNITVNATTITVFSSASDGWSFSLGDLPRGLLTLSVTGANTVSGLLSDLPPYLTYFSCLGSNTVSGTLIGLPRSVTVFSCSGSNTISGSIVDMPSYITVFSCTGSNTLTGSINSIPSAVITQFVCGGSCTISGVISSLPTSVVYVYCGGQNTVGYSGSSWYRSDMRYVYVRGASNILTATIDAALIALAAYVTTWNTEKVVNFKGSRSSASDAAVSTLQSRGVTVTVN